MNTINFPDGTIHLQATLAAASVGPTAVEGQISLPPIYHHPIICHDELRYEEDGSFSCPHATVGPEDQRLRTILNATTAYLIIELAVAAHR